MHAIRLVRDDQDDVRTFGAIMFDGDERVCETLELPSRDNQRGISCIPEGTYLCQYAYSTARKRKVYWVRDVPGREAVQIHPGNTTKDIRGCIAVGLKRGNNSVLLSRKAENALVERTNGQDFKLTIEKAEMQA